MKKFNKTSDFILYIFRMTIRVYYIIFLAVFPIVVGMCPIIPYIITHKGNWMWLLLLTIPAGYAFSTKMWAVDFGKMPEPGSWINKND